MTDVKNQFKTLRDDLKLTAEERSLMRSELVRHMGEHTEIPVSAKRPTVSPFIFFIRPAGIALSFFVAVGLLSGGVSFAANGALPGEALYLVKVGVNEKVERAFAVSQVSKATVDIRHAEERLREVELLAAHDAEDERNLEDITHEVKERILRATDTARVLREEGDREGADEIHIELESALAAHADILEAQAEGEEEVSRQRLRALSVAVSIVAKDAEEARERREDIVPEEEEEGERIALRRQELLRERLAFLSKTLGEEDIDEETETELRSELAEIEEAFGAANILFLDGEEEEANATYEALQRRVYRAHALLTSAERISEKTGKDVFIRFDGNVHETMAKEASSSESVLLMAAEPSDLPPETNLQFIVVEKVEE